MYINRSQSLWLMSWWLIHWLILTSQWLIHFIHDSSAYWWLTDPLLIAYWSIAYAYWSIISLTNPLLYTYSLARLTMYLRKTHLMVGTSDLSWLLSRNRNSHSHHSSLHPLLSPSEWWSLWTSSWNLPSRRCLLVQPYPLFSIPDTLSWKTDTSSTQSYFIRPSLLTSGP